MVHVIVIPEDFPVYEAIHRTRQRSCLVGCIVSYTGQFSGISVLSLISYNLIGWWVWVAVVYKLRSFLQDFILHLSVGGSRSVFALSIQNGALNFVLIVMDFTSLWMPWDDIIDQVLDSWFAFHSSVFKLFIMSGWLKCLF